MNSLHFKWRTILPLTLILVISITALTGLSSAMFNNNIQNAVRAEAREVAIAYANSVKTVMRSALIVPEMLSKGIAKQIQYNYADRQALSSSLAKIVANHPTITAIYLHFEPNVFDGRDGTSGRFAPYISQDPNAVSVDSATIESHYQKAKTSLTSFYTEPQKKNASMMATAVSPIVIGSRCVGMIAIETDLTSIQVDLEAQRMAAFPNSNLAVVSPGGIYVAHRLATNIGKDAYNANDGSVSALFKNAIAMNLQQEVDAFSVFHNENAAYIVAPVSATAGPPWLVGLAIPYSDLNRPITDTLWRTLLVTAISLSTIIIILYYLINLAGSRLTDITNRLIDATDSILIASNQVSGSGELLAHDSVEQAASIEETSAAVTQAAVMIKDNSDNTEKVFRLAGEAVTTVAEGLSRAEELITSMKELEVSSEEISKIINDIDDIASQTSILALNANVEAARVGDAGKGFAVVAEEVRSLAGRSSAAASNTSAIIRRNLDLSRNGVISSTEVSRVLDDISNKNSAVNSLVAQINTASREQLNGIQQLDEALSQMESITQSSAAVAEENSSAALELDAQVQELRQIQEKLWRIVYGTSASIELKQDLTLSRDIQQTGIEKNNFKNSSSPPAALSSGVQRLQDDFSSRW